MGQGALKRANRATSDLMGTGCGGGKMSKSIQF